jgi:hypothetical protein
VLSAAILRRSSGGSNSGDYVKNTYAKLRMLGYVLRKPPLSSLRAKSGEKDRFTTRLEIGNDLVSNTFHRTGRSGENGSPLSASRERLTCSRCRSALLCAHALRSPLHVSADLWFRPLRMPSRCFSTVRMLIPSACAICLVVWPSLTARQMVCWRGVSL